MNMINQPPADPLLEPFIAQTPEQARRRLDEHCQEPLAHLIRAEGSATEAARTANLSMKQAHHRLTRLLTAGLVRVVRTRPRTGRPVKVYRAVAYTEFPSS